MLSRRIANGSLDAQENPLANTVTYGVHKFHRYHTLSSHFYISRPIFTHRRSVESWPQDLREAMYSAVQASIIYQRDLSEQEAIDARKEIEGEGCEIFELDTNEQQAFRGAVEPQHDDARDLFGEEIFQLANL